MPVQTMLGAIAAGWGIVMALSPALQIRRMLATRSSRDISVGYFLLLIPGFLLWVGYGIASGDAFLAIPNATAAVVAALLITVAVTLRRRGQQ
ncbi:MAG TPA: SemiSWEET family transporter [Streptosporangiaceae bacterium]|nr:SemiSWEET family transporter [Streptosporangiaceae bacterium]